jgi:hypothetical protein
MSKLNSILFFALLLAACGHLTQYQNADRAPSSVSIPNVLSNVVASDWHYLNPIIYAFLMEISKNKSVFSLLNVPVSDAERISVMEPDSPPLSEYDPKSKMIALSKDICASPTSTLSPTDFLPALLHEFGHSLFGPNLEIELSPQLNASADQTAYTTLILKGDYLGADQLPAYLREVAAPYHELIADTITILLLDSPSAMSDFFEKCGYGANNRDFSFNYPIEGWNVGPVGGILTDGAHRLFNPVRYHIWQSRLSLRDQPNGRALVLQAIVEASISLLRDFYDKKLTRSQWAHYSQEALNRDLIARFDQILSQLDGH